MPTLPGMKPHGFYNRNSSFQRVSMEGVIDWGTQALSQMELPPSPQPITLADFGCSEGANSIVAMGRLVDAVRQRCPEQPICAIHCDLPSNNFNQLFLNLHDPAASNYLQSAGVRQAGIHPLACGGSFYGPVLAPGTVQFGMSFLAVEWMDKLPDVAVPDSIAYMQGRPEAQQAFARQAADDMRRFYEARAAELAPRGAFLILIPGSDGRRRCSDGLYDVFDDAARDLVDAGKISRGRYEEFVMPVYFRTLDELIAPIADAASPLHRVLTVDRAETLEMPTPFEDAFRETGDVETYATQYTGFLRAFSEPVAASGLLEPGQDRLVIDEMYQRIHERLVAEPARYTVRNIEVGALVRKKMGPGVRTCFQGAGA